MKIKVGNKNLTIRKWKGKDKKAFVNSLKQEDINEMEIMDALVYSCLEENVILGKEEFKYVLTRIRAHSLGEDLNVEFYCDNCSNMFKRDFLINEIITSSFSDIDEIKVDDVSIKVGEIKNKKIYVDKVSEDDMYDLLLRVKSFNGDEAFTLQDLVDRFDDLDVDILEKVINQWEDIRFKVNDVHDVDCPHCNTITKYKFDELPGFFPENWFR